MSAVAGLILSGQVRMPAVVVAEEEPPAGEDALLLDDGASVLLLDDGTSRLLLSS